MDRMRGFLAPGFALLVLLAASPVPAQSGEVRFREDFENLDGWAPVSFPKIHEHTSYSIEPVGEGHALKAESHGSASALVHGREFDVRAFPRLRWRWKVESVYKGGDEKTKDGDDYPLRVYVMFRLDPRETGFFQNVLKRSARLVYGEDLPDAALDYVWASREPVGSIYANPYAKDVKMIVLQSGEGDLGKWIEQEVDVAADYEKAFGKKPPPLARLGVMNDSDNTGSSSVSYLDSIEVFAPRAP